jgi:small redox-active disulfide protein 2
MTTDINILGPGCFTCEELLTRAELAVEQIGLNANVRHIHDFKAIMAYGIFLTPGLAIDGKLVSAGRVLTVKQICALLEPVAAQQRAHPVA